MRKRGFTLIELLVVIAIIAILAAILFPVFVSAKRSAQQTKCMNNLKQIGSAYSLYLDTWNGKFGQVGWMWWEEIRPYTRYRLDGVKTQGRSLIECPAGSNALHQNPRYYFDYGLNYNLRASWPDYTVSSSIIEKPTRTILSADRRTTMSSPPASTDGFEVGCVLSTKQWANGNRMDERHNNRASCVFVDGHASTMTNRQSIIPDTLWDLCPNDPRTN